MIGLFVVTALSVAPPLLAYHFLHADGPLPLLLVYIFVVVGLFYARAHLEGRRRLRRAAAVVLGLFVATAAVAIIIGLNITPVSAYLAWFKLAAEGAAGGTLGYMFTMKYAFFASLFAGMLFTSKPPLPIAGYLFMIALITAVILENTALALSAAAIIPAGLIVHASVDAPKPRLKGLVPIAEVLAAAFILAAPFSLSPAKNGLLGLLYSFDPASIVAQLFPNFPFLYNVPGYGHSFSSAELGARPALTSRPVYKVIAAPGSTIYLRTAVYDTYDGSGWAISTSPKKKEHAVKQPQPPDALLRPGSGTTSVPIEPAGATGPGDPSFSAQIEVNLLIDFSSALPHTLSTRVITVDTASLPPFTYANRNTGYVLSMPLVRGTRIVDKISEAPGRNPAALPVPERTADLEVGKVPAAVVSLAHRLGKGRSDEETLAAIRTYLDTNYSYSLDTTAAPRGTDAVADFLFHSRTGYCVQFATAYVILARLNGIPARYVTGFLVNIPERSDATTVTGLDAHSWAEVFVPDRGWTTEEATPPMQAASFDDPSYYSRFNPTDSGYTRRQLLALMGARVTPQNPEHPPAPRIPWLPAGAGVAAAGALALAARLLFLALSSRGAKARRIIGKIARRTELLELLDPARAGWLGWACSAGATRGRKRRALTRAATVIQVLSFAGRPARRRDLRFLRLVYRQVLKRRPVTAQAAERTLEPPLYRPRTFR